MKIYTEVTIRPHHSDFRMYEAGEINCSPENSYADYFNLLQEASSAGIEMIPLVEALQEKEFQAAGIEDIHGRIYRQPTHLFASLDQTPAGLQVIYHGIDEREVPDNFFQTT